MIHWNWQLKEIKEVSLFLTLSGGCQGKKQKFVSRCQGCSQPQNLRGKIIMPLNLQDTIMAFVQQQLPTNLITQRW